MHNIRSVFLMLAGATAVVALLLLTFSVTLAVGGIRQDAGEDPWLNLYLYSRAQSVMGGTSQIQRNLIATRILRLPSE